MNMNCREFINHAELRVNDSLTKFNSSESRKPKLTIQIKYEWHGKSQKQATTYQVYYDYTSAPNFIINNFFHNLFYIIIYNNITWTVEYFDSVIKVKS